MLSKRVWRYARDNEPPKRTPLRAGPLTLFREEGDLCAISLGGREVLRRVYAAIRDRNWGTPKPVLSKLSEEVHSDGFRVSFEVENRDGPVHFSWKGLMTGAADGTIRFTFDGVARSTFLRNRIGFCVLHPDSCAGARCNVTHPDGSTGESTFPMCISPHQPFLEVRALSHEISPGVWAEVVFEGEVFETEDQRNWTDASYKTYCTPLRLPFPVEIAAGTRVFQAVTLRLRGEGGAVAAAKVERARTASKPVTVDLAAAQPARPFPRLGLASASHGGELSEAQLTRLRALRLDHLRVDLDLSSPDSVETLRRAAREAAALGAKLEIALFLSDAAPRELEELRVLCADLPCAVARWLVFRSGESCTAERWVAMARSALEPCAPGATFASGTNAYFTELNRGSPPGPSSDALVYSLNPQIHSFDDRSIMETLSAQPATVESARAIGGKRRIFVSPVTLKPRFNVVATGPIPPVPPGELPPQVDVRQMSLFAAAWTLGCIARLAGSEAAGVTFFETTGWRGIMELEEGPPVPERFPALPGCVFPVYHVLADLAERGQGGFGPGASLAPLVVDGFSLQAEGSSRTLLANLTPEPVAIRLTALGRAARLRSLDESVAEQACRAPSDFRAAAGSRIAVRRERLAITLLPHAVVRIDWEE